MRTVTRASTALKNARAIVETSWCRGQFKIEGKRDRFCASGAVHESCGARWKVVDPYERTDVQPTYPNGWNHSEQSRACLSYLEAALETLVDEGKLSKRYRLSLQVRYYGDFDIVKFNDEYARNRKDVLAVFDRAIKLAKRTELKAWRAKRAAA